MLKIVILGRDTPVPESVINEKKFVEFIAAVAKAQEPCQEIIDAMNDLFKRDTDRVIPVSNPEGNCFE